MPVDWTPHRFSGGLLVLDAANTVVHRNAPEKRFDRFDDAREIARFAEAAQALRPDEFAGRRLAAGDAAALKPRVIAIREAADALFRDAAASKRLRLGLIAPLLRAAADGLAADAEASAEDAADAGPLRFEAALGLSALALLAGAEWRRARVCPNCAWLFIDRSRNGSRIWCDMAVCGNRQKARRHYRRRREDDHA